MTLRVGEKIEIYISLNKNGNKVDMIIVSENGAASVRSTTELINKLMKDFNISFEKIVNDVIPFVDKKLKELRGDYLWKLKK